MENRKWKLEIGNWKLEIGNWKLEAKKVNTGRIRGEFGVKAIKKSKRTIVNSNSKDAHYLFSVSVSKEILIFCACLLVWLIGLIPRWKGLFNRRKETDYYQCSKPHG